MRVLARGLTICALGWACAAAPALAADTNEPNETPQTATGPLIGGVTYTAEIDHLSSELGSGSSIEDRDYYGFYVSKPTALDITYTQAYTGVDCYAPQLVLFDATGEKVLGSVHPVGEGTGHLKYQVTDAASFIIRVQPYYVRTCQPDKSAYSFQLDPAGSITTPPVPAGESPPKSVTPAQVEPGSPNVKPNTGGGGSASTGGGSTGGGGTTALRASGLSLRAAMLRDGILRASGKLRTAASIKQLALTVERKVGTRTIRRTFRAQRVGSDEWKGSVRLPASMRSAKAVRLRVAFSQHNGFAAKRLALRTVTAR